MVRYDLHGMNSTHAGYSMDISRSAYLFSMSKKPRSCIKVPDNRSQADCQSHYPAHYQSVGGDLSALLTNIASPSVR
jgi:hypothetical protein